MRQWMWAVLGCWAITAAAQEVRVGDLRLTQALARPTVAAQANGGAYVTIENLGKQPDRLLRASTPAAATVELHTMSMDKHVMRMRQVKDIPIPAQGKVSMAPGQGYHLMLMQLKAPLSLHGTVPVMLEFERAGKVQAEFRVQHMEAGKPVPHHAH